MSTNPSLNLTCSHLPTWDGDRITNYLNVRKRLTTCELVARSIDINSITANSASIPLLAVMDGNFDSIQVQNIQITGNLEMCSTSSLGTLLVSDGVSQMVCFDPQTVGATPGQVLQFTGTGPVGVTWAGLSGSGVCTDIHGLNVGNGVGGIFCVNPDPTYPYPQGAGQLVAFDGDPGQTPSNAPPQKGVHFGPAATGADALVTFDPTLLSGGMPKWTPTPTTHNAILYNDTTLVAGSRLTWTNGPSNPNSLLFVDPLNVPNWLAPPTQTNALMYYDGANLNWISSGAGSNENLLVIKASAPTWLSNPGSNSILTHQGGVTQWTAGAPLPPGTVAGDLLVWDGTNWTMQNCSVSNALLVGNGAGGYGCLVGPINDNAILYYDAGINSLAWSASAGIDENLLVIKTSTPSWLGNPVSNAVLVHQGGVTQWDTNIYLTGAAAGAGGAIPYWNGTGWSFVNCALGNNNALLVSNGLGSYGCVGGPTVDNAILYYDAGTGLLLWSATGVDENVMVIKASAPTWLSNPASDSVLVHQGGSTQWASGAVVPSGAVSGDLLVWDGVSWITFNCSSVNNLIVGNGTGYSCVTAPLSTNALMYFDGVSLQWMASTGNDNEILYVAAGSPTWLPNPVSNAVLVQQGGTTQWDTNIYLTGAGAGLAGAVPYWNGSGWSFANCAQGNVNAIMVSSGIGTYSCVDGPLNDNALLYYDSGTGLLAWSAAGVDENVMVIKASAPTWLGNPGANAALVHAGGVTQWDTTAYITGSGLAAGDLIYWDGSAWVPLNCTGSGLRDSLIVGDVGNSYTCLQATVDNSILYYDTTSSSLTWSTSGVDENLMVIKTSAPTWLGNPPSDAVLVHQGGSTQWDTNIYLNGAAAGVGGAIPYWTGAGWTFANCALGTINALLVSSGIGTYGCVAGPTNDNALLYYDAATTSLVWSGPGMDENLMVVKGSAPSWLGNPVSNAVLVHQGGVTQWDTDIYLSGSGALLPGEIPYWDGSAWTTANCAQGNVNAILVSSGLGTYSCVDGPLDDNAILYYDSGTGLLAWSLAGVDENVMVIKGSAPSWLGNPISDGVLVHQGGTTQWDTNVYLNGATAGAGGAIPYWTGAGWTFANCALGNVNALLVSSGIGTYGCVAGPTNDNSLLYYDAATTSLVWSGSGADENLMVVKGSAPTWLGNPASDSVLVQESSSTVWSTPVGASATDPLYMNHDGANFQWSPAFPRVLMASSHIGVTPGTTTTPSNIDWNYILFPPSTTDISTAGPVITFNVSGNYLFFVTCVYFKDASGGQTTFFTEIFELVGATQISQVVVNRLDNQTGHTCMTIPVTCFVGNQYVIRFFTNNNNGIRQLVDAQGGLIIMRMS